MIGVALIHTQLAIVVSQGERAQPKQSSSAEDVIVLEDQMYNIKLRASHKTKVASPTHGRGDSDRGALLAFLNTGHQKTLELIEGMISSALLDRRLSELSIVKHQLSEKHSVTARTKNEMTASL